MHPALRMLCVGALLLAVLSRDADGVPRRHHGTGRSPVPIEEAPDPVTRAPCDVLPHEQREGLQYTDTTEEIASGTADIMAPLKPGNYSYSGSYRPGDPCSYE